MSKILAVGPIWRGSNAGGLFRAMMRKGISMDIVDEFYYLSLHPSTLPTKVLYKAIRPIQVAEYNKAIINSINTFNPDIVFVYKGAFVYPQTLKYAKDRNTKLAMFYPDVSITAHGSFLPKNMPYFDIVFTTKTFGIEDMKKAFGIERSYFIPHGYDPEIHRKLMVSQKDVDTFGCDVSFIGTWSPKKEMLLSYIKEKCPDIDLKIWGGQWEKNTSRNIDSCIINRLIYGDLYATAIQCSKINLGILNERVTGASSGDLITSRTFHIPGATGFMLHERNKESVLYFIEDTEAAFFDDKEELVEKIRYYLANDALRNEIALAGHERAKKDHSLDQRATAVLAHLEH